jgi:hypothetical protein
MIDNPKTIWKLANQIEANGRFAMVDGNEWIRVNPDLEPTREEFQRWLDSKPIRPTDSVFLVRGAHEVDESTWGDVLTQWPEIFVEGQALRVLSQDYSWVLVFSDIGVAKFGEMKPDSK